MPNDKLRIEFEKKFEECKWEIVCEIKNDFSLKLLVKINLDDLDFIHSFDAFNAASVKRFLKLCSEKLERTSEAIDSEFRKVLSVINDKKKELSDPQKKEPLTDEEREQAVVFAKHPDLLDRIAETVENLGVIGESTNVKIIYIAGCSRRMKKPISVTIQGGTSSGKSEILKKTLKLFSEKDIEDFTYVSKQAFFYAKDIKNKIILITEHEGLRNAEYAIKALQSEGKLSAMIPVFGSNGFEIRPIEIDGPVSFLSTTTSLKLDEELQNRNIVLTMNESPVQTKKIIEFQNRRRTSKGLQKLEVSEESLILIRNVQEIFKDIKVINNYAEELEFPYSKTRFRRDNEEYLNIMENVAFVRQYQKEKFIIKKDTKHEIVVLVDIKDIIIANDLFGKNMGNFDVGFPPQTRKIFDFIIEMVEESTDGKEERRANFKISQKEIVTKSNGQYSPAQIKDHVKKIVDMHYLRVNKPNRKNEPHRYEVLSDKEYKDLNFIKRFENILVDPESLSAYSEIRAKYIEELKFSKIEYKILGVEERF